MALFIDSTQATHWTIPSEKLSERRARAVSRVSSRHGSCDEDELLSIDDEACLRTFHERRMLTFIRKAGLPEKLGATAVTYFKRFYIDRSVTEYNPCVTAVSCLYAAGKVEEIYLPAQRLASDFDVVVNGISQAQVSAEQLNQREFNEEVPGELAVRVSEDKLLQWELSFLQHLQFHLVCYHGFRSLGALRETLKRKQLWVSDDEKGMMMKGECKMLKQVCKKAHLCIAWRVPLTELVVTDTPAVVAMAAVATAATDEGAEKNDEDAVTSVLGAATQERHENEDEVNKLQNAVLQAVWTLRNTSAHDADGDSGGMDEGYVRECEAKRRRWQVDADAEEEGEEDGEGEGEKKKRKRRSVGSDSWSDEEGGGGGAAIDSDIDSDGDGEGVRRLSKAPGDGGDVKRRRMT